MLSVCVGATSLRDPPPEEKRHHRSFYQCQKQFITEYLQPKVLWMLYGEMTDNIGLGLLYILFVLGFAFTSVKAVSRLGFLFIPFQMNFKWNIYFRIWISLVQVSVLALLISYNGRYLSGTGLQFWIDVVIETQRYSQHSHEALAAAFDCR